MKYERFEDLPVWNAAIDLAVKVSALTEDRAFGPQGDLRSQLRRAALSVSNNIAEGFERGTTNELIAFLYIARGSAGEVRSMLNFSERSPWSGHLKSQISDLKLLAESCSKQLHGWAESLQNSEIKGQRHLNDITREKYFAAKRSNAVWEKLQAIRDEAVARQVAALGNPMEVADRLAAGESEI
jgi:four helix bundle protein